MPETQGRGNPEVLTAPDVVGRPLAAAVDALGRAGFAVGRIECAAAPPRTSRKYQPPQFSEKTPFVVMQRPADGGAVDLVTVECGEPGAMNRAV